MRIRNYFLISALIFSTIMLGKLYGQSSDITQRKNPLRVAGSLVTQAEAYYVQGIESARKPFSYFMSGDFNPEIFGIKLPFSFLLSNRSFSYAQPFNRMGISPEYKWVRFHFGYRNLSFSKYTLAGHSFLGAGVELTPGIFRLSALYGRFKKKTIPNTVNPLDTLIAPMRYGYAVKMGLGNEKTFVDLVFMHIKDDTLTNESSELLRIKTPQSNVVTGINLQITLTENLVLDAESALSFLTRDQYASKIEGINMPRIENMANLLAINISSQYSTAIRAGLKYSRDAFSAGIEYRRIDPNYTSFGAYYFNTDIENFTFNTRFRLFQNKLSIRGNVGIQNDNVQEQKTTRSNRFISMVAANYTPVKMFSIDGSFSNYSISQQAGRLPLDDTIRLFQTNRSLSIIPRLIFGKEKLQQVIQLTLSQTGLIDKNPNTADMNEVNSNMAMLNYIVSFVPIHMNINTGLSYIELSNALATRKNYTLVFGVNKSFFKNKINTGLSASGGRSIVNQNKGWVMNSACNILYRPFKKHGFKFFFIYQKNEYPQSSALKSYKEIKTNVSYVYSF